MWGFEGAANRAWSPEAGARPSLLRHLAVLPGTSIVNGSVADRRVASFLVANGMSANRGMPWDIESTRRLIGYEPQDDIWNYIV